MCCRSYRLFIHYSQHFVLYQCYCRGKCWINTFFNSSTGTITFYKSIFNTVDGTLVHRSSAVILIPCCTKYTSFLILIYLNDERNSVFIMYLALIWHKNYFIPLFGFQVIYEFVEMVLCIVSRCTCTLQMNLNKTELSTHWRALLWNPAIQSRIYT